jgi:hypothetical protein
MNTKSDGNMLIDALKGVFISIIRLCGILLAWILKGAGLLLLYISKQLFNLSRK